MLQQLSRASTVFTSPRAAAVHRSGGAMPEETLAMPCQVWQFGCDACRGCGLTTSSGPLGGSGGGVSGVGGASGIVDSGELVALARSGISGSVREAIRDGGGGGGVATGRAGINGIGTVPFIAAARSFAAFDAAALGGS